MLPTFQSEGIRNNPTDTYSNEGNLSKKIPPCQGTGFIDIGDE